MVVVAGAHPEAVREAVGEGAGVELVQNADWTSGQLSSLLAGLDAVDDPALEAVAVTLVDVPLVRASTVAAAAGGLATVTRADRPAGAR